MTIERPPRWRLRTLILAVATVVLAWVVISSSLAAYLADAAPETALKLNPREPVALVNLADRMLGTPASASRPDRASQSAEPKNADGAAPNAANGATANAQGTNPAFSAFDDFDQRPGVDLPTIRDWIASSLPNAPLDSRAMRILGQAADAAKDHVQAAKFMNAAARLSLHDQIANYWLIVNSAEAKDYKTTLYYADVFLRTSPELGRFVLPLLAGIAEDKSSVDLLSTLLVSDPPWRDQFLQQLPYGVADARTPLALLLALRTSADPPTSDDVNRYLNFLVGHKFYDLAYYTWLQFLPPEQLRNAGLLYNGGFEIVPSGSPFDWLIAQGAGVTVDIQAKPNDNSGHALVLNFEYGRVEYQSVTQLIKLPPGRYHFTGQSKGELVGPRGLKWRVACAESPTSYIAESAMISGRASAWRDSEFDFKVPQQDCRAQYLSLDLDARMPSERFITGTIWFDDLRISRIDEQPNQ
jgi:hypothetical protein